MARSRVETAKELDAQSEASKGTALTLQERFSKRLVDDIMVDMTNKISVAGKVFEYKGVTSRAQELDVVILGAVIYKAWYPGEYDPNNIEPPSCFSIGARIQNDCRPSGNSPDKQAESCKDCPRNAWGSARRGKGKDCGDKWKLAVLPAGDYTQDIATLTISPSGFSRFRKYVSTIAAQHDLPPCGVITTLHFDESQPYPVVQARFKATLPLEMADAVEARLGEADRILES